MTVTEVTPSACSWPSTAPDTCVALSWTAVTGWISASAWKALNCATVALVAVIEMIFPSASSAPRLEAIAAPLSTISSFRAEPSWLCRRAMSPAFSTCATEAVIAPSSETTMKSRPEVPSSPPRSAEMSWPVSTTVFGPVGVNSTPPAPSPETFQPVIDPEGSDRLKL